MFPEELYTNPIWCLYDNMSGEVILKHPFHKGTQVPCPHCNKPLQFSPYKAHCCDQDFKVSFGEVHQVIPVGRHNKQFGRGWSSLRPYKKVTTENKKTEIVAIEIEAIKDGCWRCHQAIQIITGCYTAGGTPLIPLKHLSDQARAGMTQAVNLLRKNDPLITPVSMRYSKTVGYEYFAASCPKCKALQGDFFVTEERTMGRAPHVRYQSPVPIMII